MNILRIATTLSSFNISIEPREMKYNDVNISPRCVMISPGGAWVVLNFIENVRKQPSLASLNAEQFLSNWLFKWRQISACKHSGKPLSTIFMSIPLKKTKYIKLKIK